MPNPKMSTYLAYGMMNALWAANSVMAKTDEQEAQNETGVNVARAGLGAVLALQMGLVLYMPLYLNGLIDSPMEAYRKWQEKKTLAEDRKYVKSLKHPDDVKFLSEQQLNQHLNKLQQIQARSKVIVERTGGLDWRSKDLLSDANKILHDIHRAKVWYTRPRKQDKRSIAAPPIAVPPPTLKPPENAAQAPVAGPSKQNKAESEKQKIRLHAFVNEVIEEVSRMLQRGDEAFHTFTSNKSQILNYFRTNGDRLLNASEWEIAQLVLNHGGLKQKKYPNIYQKALEKYAQQNEVEQLLAEYTFELKTDMGGPSNPYPDFEVESDEDDVEEPELPPEPVATKQPILLARDAKGKQPMQKKPEPVVSLYPVELQSHIDLLEAKYDLLKRCQKIHAMYENDPDFVKQYINKHQLSSIRHGVMHLDIKSTLPIQSRVRYYKKVLARLDQVNFDRPAPLKYVCLGSESKIFHTYEQSHVAFLNGSLINTMPDFDAAMNMIESRFAQLNDTRYSAAAREMIMVEIGEIYQQLANESTHHHLLLDDPRSLPAIRLRYEFAHREQISDQTMNNFLNHIPDTKNKLNTACPM